MHTLTRRLCACGAPVDPYRASRCRPCTRELERHAKREGAKARRLLPAVIERDGTDCGLCGHPVDLTLTWPATDRTGRPGAEPGYPVPDHIVPLVAGGVTELANLRLAHWLCNSQRGAR